MRPASEAEKARLNETFAELCRISSPFGEERAVADEVSGRLRAMGLEVEEDDFGDGGAEVGEGLGAVLDPDGVVAGVAEEADEGDARVGLVFDDQDHP